MALTPLTMAQATIQRQPIHSVPFTWPETHRERTSDLRDGEALWRGERVWGACCALTFLLLLPPRNCIPPTIQSPKPQEP